MWGTAAMGWVHCRAASIRPCAAALQESTRPFPAGATNNWEATYFDFTGKNTGYRKTGKGTGRGNDGAGRRMVRQAGFGLFRSGRLAGKRTKSWRNFLGSLVSRINGLGMNPNLDEPEMVSEDSSSLYRNIRTGPSLLCPEESPGQKPAGAGFFKERGGGLYF